MFKFNREQEIIRDYESKMRIHREELKTEVSQAVATKEKECAELRQTNAVLSKEVEILEKAFENMGFDVKDMKDILNRLVDGIVSKNQIQVISTGFKS